MAPNSVVTEIGSDITSASDIFSTSCLAILSCKGFKLTVNSLTEATALTPISFTSTEAVANKEIAQIDNLVLIDNELITWLLHSFSDMIL